MANARNCLIGSVRLLASHSMKGNIWREKKALHICNNNIINIKAICIYVFHTKNCIIAKENREMPVEMAALIWQRKTMNK